MRVKKVFKSTCHFVSRQGRFRISTLKMLLFIFFPPNGNPQFLPGPTKMRRKPEALNFKEEPSTVVMPTSLTSQRELSHHWAAIIQETHRTNPELFPSLCTRACLYAQLLQPAFSHSCGLRPSRLLCPWASPCTQQILFPCISGEFCLRVQCRGSTADGPVWNSSRAQAVSQPQDVPGQSCSDLTVHPNSTTCSKASPEPAELGRAKTACLWAGLQDARPGAQAHLFLSEDPRSLGGFRAGEGTGGLGPFLTVKLRASARRPRTADRAPRTRAGPAHGASQHRGGQSSSYRVSKYFCCQEEACRQRTDLPRNSGPR